MTSTQKLDLGTARLLPKRAVTAGSVATIRFSYTAGHPVDDTGYIKIAFRFAGDFGQPQFDDPSGENYCSVTTTGDCRIVPRWDMKGHTRPWGRCVLLKVMGGFLDHGDKVEVVFGDKSGGSAGWRIQTFCEDSFEFKALVDPIATFEFKELPKSPVLKIIPGKARRAVCIAPSRLVTGRSFVAYLKLEDKWGNPMLERPRRLKCQGYDKPGVQRVKAKDSRTGFIAVSNPIRVYDEEPPLRPFWADFHGQSEETIGTNTIRDYFIFSRDVAMLDIAAHQGNDFQVTDDFWQTINRAARRFYDPGKFVTFPGYEWSGNTPLGGDRNVYFASEGARIVHSCTDLVPGKKSQHPTASTATELFKELRKQKRFGAFVFAHVGGRYADMATHDRDLETAIEIHSAWGTFEWLLEDALARGYRVGVCANSDGHKGRPGASYPGASKFGSYGGLTCVLAHELTRGGILEAIRARHTYATTGNRSLLDVRLEMKGGRDAIMGDVVDAPGIDATLAVRVVGTDPVECVEVMNGDKTVETFRPYAKADLGRRIKLVWSGAEVRGRDRKTCWDGKLKVKGNAIRSLEPINFWNPDMTPQRTGNSSFEWSSITTGGTAGLILSLDKENAGVIELETAQKTVRCAVKSLDIVPCTWACGGVRKMIQAYRLPNRMHLKEFCFSMPLKKLERGDNPIFVRVTQEDGHMAWSSPIYIVK